MNLSLSSFPPPSVSIHVHTNTHKLSEVRKVYQILCNWIIGSCELPNMGTGRQTQRAKTALKFWPISPSPHICLCTWVFCVCAWFCMYMLVCRCLCVNGCCVCILLCASVVIWMKMAANRPIGSDFIGGVDMLELVQPFWRKCVTWGVVFEVLKAQARLRGLLLLPANVDVELSATSTMFSTMVAMN